MKKKTDWKGMAIGLAGAVQYARNSVVSQTLLNQRAGTLTLFAFDAGQGLSEHTAPYDATVVILDGEASITIGGKRVKVKTGQMIIMPANKPHALQAKVRFKMLLIMIR